MIILIALIAGTATFLGGLFALYCKDRLHLILGFSAGAVIGVAFFDLIPESFELAQHAYSPGTIAAIIGAGFLGYMILDRFILLHSHTDETTHTHGNSHRGIFGVISLSIHSFLDGAAIGLAFQVSPAIGAIVAVAVLAHDFSDGINTVAMIIKNGGTKMQALKWLVIDAIAPTLGILSTLFFTLPKETLGIILSVFAGFFLYIGASDLLPESHHSHPTIWTTITTLLGVGVIYVLIRTIGM